MWEGEGLNDSMVCKIIVENTIVTSQSSHKETDYRNVEQDLKNANQCSAWNLSDAETEKDNVARSGRRYNPASTSAANRH